MSPVGYRTKPVAPSDWSLEAILDCKRRMIATGGDDQRSSFDIVVRDASWSSLLEEEVAMTYKQKIVFLFLMTMFASCGWYAVMLIVEIARMK